MPDTVIENVRSPSTSSVAVASGSVNVSPIVSSIAASPLSVTTGELESEDWELEGEVVVEVEVEVEEVVASTSGVGVPPPGGGVAVGVGVPPATGHFNAR